VTDRDKAANRQETRDAKSSGKLKDILIERYRKIFLHSGPSSSFRTVGFCPNHPVREGRELGAV